jgi:hypothetical protein
MTKIGYLIDQLESHKNHYGWDHPVIFKLGDETLVVTDIFNNDSGSEIGTVIKFEKKGDI